MKRIILIDSVENVVFHEYVQTFCCDDEVVLYDSTTAPFTENINYLCIRKIPYHLLPVECKIGFVNTEQLCVPSKFIEYMYIVNHKKEIEIFDYSLHNISIVGKGIHFPYSENKSETEYLKTLLKVEKEYDIGIIGGLSDYRKAIIEILKTKGYSVLYISNQWGDARDSQIAKCKQLVNLHYSSEYQLYESIRCNRWQYAGMPIYSEPCIDGLPKGVQNLSVLMDNDSVNKMNEVTIVLTSCGRPDLLKKTIESFLQYNTYPIKQWIIIEDSGVPNSELEKVYPNFMWITNSQRMGQIKSIDKAYSLVTTDLIFHLEDDWETYNPGCIEESLQILKSSDTISAVMCREPGQGGYRLSDTPPLLNCWGEWGHYSFNPGLRRLSDYKDLFKGSYSSFIQCAVNDGLKGEIAINGLYKENGFKMAMTSKGYVKHIGDNRHVGSNKTIGLCMIVKDEAHIIREVLECTLPLIDTYCIVDTGSTDNTIKTIKTFYDSKGISGKVYEREWKNFGHNRSEALALCDGLMDYIFVMDADDLITFPSNGKAILQSFMNRSPNGIEFTMVQGSLRYTRMLGFKAGDGWKYKGVLHEYPANDKANNRICKAHDFLVESRRLGARTIQDPGNKMKRDIAVLEKGLLEEPDNERYMFYLAQSYRDDGQTDKAVEMYKKRFEIGRWYEEAYISAYNVAKLLNSKEWAWKAHESNPKRIECLYSYISWCRATSKFSQELYAMAMYASTIPKPVDQHLFVETDIYDWKIFDELSIIAFYTGHRDVALQASDKLLKDNKFPEHHRHRITTNRSFAVPKN